jgi:hypothetical protein
VRPWPVRADGQGPLPGVAGEAGGDVPDPERVRVGFPQVRVVAVAEEAGPGGQVGGDVRGDDPAGVDLPGLRGEVAHHAQFIGTVHRQHAVVETNGVRTPKAMGLAPSGWKP